MDAKLDAIIYRVTAQEVNTSADFTNKVLKQFGIMSWPRRRASTPCCRVSSVPMASKTKAVAIKVRVK